VTNVMRGYLNPARGKPPRPIVDGWLHTGDVGRFDEGRLPGPRRPGQGHDHPRRREHLHPARSRAVVHGLPQIAEGPAVVGRAHPGLPARNRLLFVSLHPEESLEVDAIRDTPACFLVEIQVCR